MSDESREIKTMRLMAWTRAKGELDSFLNTFLEGDQMKFTRIHGKFREFINEVEKEGLF